MDCDTAAVRRIFARSRLVAPFLLSERGALWLSRDLEGAGGEDGLGEGPRRAGRTLSGVVEGAELADVALSALAGGGATLRGVGARGSSWTRCQLAGATLESVDAEDSTWDVIDLTDAQLAGLKGHQARFSLTSFRGARLRDCDLRGAIFVLCDFTSADLKDVDLTGARLVGCEVEDATLTRVNMQGADLGGCSFQRAWLEDVTLDGVLAAGADFRGALGVSEVDALRSAGARVGGGGLLRLWARIFGGTPETHGRALAATSATWAALAIAVPLIFFGRAVLWPINPDQAPGEEPYEEPDEPEVPDAPAGEDER